VSDDPNQSRPRRRWAAFLLVTGLGIFGAYQALFHPKTPLPPQWNPTVPFDIAHPLTPLTGWKLDPVAADRGQCLSALAASVAQFTPMPDFEESETCHIRNRVRLTGLGDVVLRPVETRCDMALRLAVWGRHGVQPFARAKLGQGVSEIHHQGSYNCRRIRTSSGNSTRWSTHATAQGFDISGFTLSDGRKITLTAGWTDPEVGSFLRAVQKVACDVFGLVLGPDYNLLHADHFHIQTTGNGCR